MNDILRKTSCIILILFLLFLVVSGNASALTSLSFEDYDINWDAEGFQRIPSFTDKAGNQHYPTDGLYMLRVTNTYGAASMAFTGTDTSMSLSVDIDLIDPVFSLSPKSGNDMEDFAAMVFWISLYDSSGKIVMFDILPFPSEANRWQTFSAPLTNLTAGETYKLEISTEPNGIMCIQIDGFECPGVIAGGTVLLDNIRLFSSSESGSPDLVVTSVSDLPAGVKCGGSFKIADTIVNQSDRTSGKYTIRYYLSLDTVKDSSDIQLKAKHTIKRLKAGKTLSKKAKLTIPMTASSGNYYLIACADDTSKVTEANEDNNCIASSTTIEVK
jgi:hypothetical protein